MTARSTRRRQRTLRARAGLGGDHDASVQPGEERPRRGLRAHAFKRDYVNDDLWDVETVLAQLGEWIDDYNRQAPHSALGIRPPAAHRAAYRFKSE